MQGPACRDWGKKELNRDPAGARVVIQYDGTVALDSANTGPQNIGGSAVTLEGLMSLVLKERDGTQKRDRGHC
ncbi:hypothetical protein NDU88_000454 [Pleurodeles waltl]|uniref:Uncharacterized protein n=1 Tax=Pleurodeles waltl TaxID=8319 RepID=A0AAV7UTE8_PLEWA|nr:hypothetical protein NDU88_000454 [Pleurodeles waltl]